MRKTKFNKSENLLQAYIMHLDGKKPSEIARTLNLNVRTIYRYMESILKVEKEYPIV